MNVKPVNKEKGQLKKMKLNMNRAMQDCVDDLDLFTLEDLNMGMSNLKRSKASGEDGITMEMILHFGEKAKNWLLSLFNNCVSSLRIPKMWRRARVVALLKPGKDPTSPKSYRPISLLCILYKLYDVFYINYMILARIQGIIKDNLTAGQAGFRPGRSCCS